MDKLHSKLPLVESVYQLKHMDVWKTLSIFFIWLCLSFYLAFLSTHSNLEGSMSELLWNAAIVLMSLYFVGLYFASSYLIPVKPFKIGIEEDGILVNNKRKIPWSDITALRIENNWQTFHTGFTIIVRKGRNVSISMNKPGRTPSLEWEEFNRMKNDLIHILQ